jgi:hypothetical protein
MVLVGCRAQKNQGGFEGFAYSSIIDDHAKNRGVKVHHFVDIPNIDAEMGGGRFRDFQHVGSGFKK